MNDCAVIWFRQDLRLLDNPALTEASNHKLVIPIYIFDDVNPDNYIIGEAGRWWLHQSLEKLNISLNNQLSIYRGNPVDIINDIINRYNVTSIYWNRCYEPWIIKRDKNIKETLTGQNVKVKSYNASLLWEPWEIKKNDGTPYKVFTPFYRKGCLGSIKPRSPLPCLDNIKYIYDKDKSLKVDGMGLIPKNEWYKKLDKYWQAGEKAAHSKLDEFLNVGIKQYKEGRNFPAKNFISRLSPYLHFGEISPNQLWNEINKLENNINTDHFRSELGWREFSYSLLYYNNNLPNNNLQSKFDNFPWSENKKDLEAWKKGKTGIPMVDAGMRELWETGYMHNRSRMIVGSFLVKNLLIHWKHVERWFWDTLVDADLANNSASWQWIAGCGADAAPYFRIFNPVTQGKKFDPDGEYIRRYIPEISKLPNKYIFSPWEATYDILKEADIELGTTYPYPIVDLKKSRQQALDAFKSISNIT